MLKNFFAHLYRNDYFKSYKDQIAAINSDTVVFLSFVGFVVAVINLIVRALTSDHLATNHAAILFFYATFVFGVNIKNKGTVYKHSTLLCYLIQMPILTFSAFMSTVLDPNVQAFTFLICIVILPFYILDKPWRVTLYILGESALFAVLSWSCKTPENFATDMMHLSVCILFAWFTDMFMLNTRIENVKKSMSFMTDSEHDPLTGLYNRRGGEEKIRQYIKADTEAVFMLIDVDNFKSVNDNYGHDQGDKVLNDVSHGLVESFRKSDVVMRIGGDEFVIYAPGLKDMDLIKSKLDHINKTMREVKCAGKSNVISVSIGAVYDDGTWPDYDTIYKRADEMLYEMKNKGKDGFRLSTMSYFK